MLSLARIFRDYDESARSLAELLPFLGLLSPSVVVNKDGSLMASFAFDGIDVDGLPIEQVNTQAAQVEHALRNLHGSTSLWWTVHRRRSELYPESTFSDPISRFIDERRRAAVIGRGQYVNRHYVTLVRSPEGATDALFGGLASLMTQDRRGALSSSLGLLRSLGRNVHGRVVGEGQREFVPNELRATLARFEEMVESFESAIAALGMRRLASTELLGFLHDCTSPASAGQCVVEPNSDFHMDSWLCSDFVENDSTDRLRFRGAARSVLAAPVVIKDWPDMVKPGLLDAILATPGELTLTSVFRCVEPVEAKRYLDRVRRFNLNTRYSLMGLVLASFFNREPNSNDPAKDLAAGQVDEASEEMSVKNLGYGFSNTTILCYGTTREACEATVSAVAGKIRGRDMLALRETHHALSAWSGSIPGQWAELVRWLFVSTAHLANCAPVRSVSMGVPENRFFTEQRKAYSPALTVFQTEYATPFFFSTHLADLGNAFVVGPSRTGKSVAVNLLLSQFGRYAPCKRFIFDKDYSCRIPTLLQGGQHVNLGGSDGSLKLNPLTMRHTMAGRQWLVRWLQLLCEAGKLEFTNEDASELWKQLEFLADTYGPEETCRLSSLHNMLNPRLKSALDPWCEGGAWGEMFDNEEDKFDLGVGTEGVDDPNRFICFEMGRVFDTPAVACAFLEYAFRRIDMDMESGIGTPTLIYLEECWFLLQDPKMRAKIRDYLRTIAKRLGFVIMSTQSLEDLAQPEVKAVIGDNIPTRIFLPNPNAGTQKDMYMNGFGLTVEQVDRIAAATSKRDYYLVTPAASRMVQLSLTPEVLACLRSDKLAQQTFDCHYAARANRATWKQDYIKEMSHET